MVPLFSRETDVTLSTPFRPLRLSSILRTTPSSISCGDAPGYATLILIILESTKGKKDDLRDKTPKIPNTKNAIIKTFTAT